MSIGTAGSGGPALPDHHSPAGPLLDFYEPQDAVDRAAAMQPIPHRARLVIDAQLLLRSQQETDDRRREQARTAGRE